MCLYADYECSLGKIVICDFVCPTERTRENFMADITIWMDTIKESRYQDTNLLFEKPTTYDFAVTMFSNDQYSSILNNIKNKLS